MAPTENPRKNLEGKRFTYQEAVEAEKYCREHERTGDSSGYRWGYRDSEGNFVAVAGTQL